MRLLFPCLLLMLACPLWAQQPSAPTPLQQAPGRIQLYGTVTDSLSGKPVYDCLVGYYGRDGERLAVSPVNSDGRYSLFIPAGEAFELRVERENGYQELRQGVGPIPLAQRELRMDLKLVPR